MTSASRARWDPVEVLGLSIGDSIRCHGKRKNGHGCCNPVGKQWHSEIEKALRGISQLSPTQVTERNLASLAHWLLCNRYHRGEQDYTLASHWFDDLVRYIEKGVSAQADTTYVEGSQSADAQAKKDGALEAAVRLYDRVQKAEEGLKEEHSKCEQLLETNMFLDCTVQRLRTAREMDKSRLSEMESQILAQRKLHQEEIQAAGRCYDDAQAKHASEVKGLLEALQTKERLLDKNEEELRRERQSRAAAETRLKDENGRLKLKQHFRALQCHIQFRLWQRTCAALKADNETLMVHQKCLQQTASSFEAELEAKKRSLKPLGLDEVKKGLHTVFSLQPMRLRTLRIST